MATARQDLKDDARRAFKTPFGAVILIEVKDGRAFWVDGRTDPPSLLEGSPADRAADCIWSGGATTIQRVLDGEKALESAYVSGRLSITGDMSVMARLKMESKT